MHAIQATYKKGVFTPAEPLELPEGSQVTLWLDPAGTEIAQLRPKDRAFLGQLTTQRAEVFRRLAE